MQSTFCIFGSYPEPHSYYIKDVTLNNGRIAPNSCLLNAISLEDDHRYGCAVELIVEHLRPLTGEPW